MSAHQPGACPRCGTAFAPRQEYCLECGLRLPGRTGVFAGVAASWARRGWYPGDWVWPVLVFLILACLGALTAIVLSSNGNADTINAVPASSGSIPVVTEPPATAPTVPTTTEAPPATTAPRTTPRPPGELTAWPTRDGYTVILQSIPAGAGRTNAVRTAKQALSAGLTQVGVLDSAQYSSLHPGYFVVFTGIYSSNSEASAHVSQARSAGFGAAYVRPITH